MTVRQPAWLLLPLGALLGGGPATAQRTPPTRQVVYKTVGETPLALEIYEPDGHQPSDNRPAIVFFFGGGWNSGGPGQFSPHAAYLASRGMWAACAVYRTKTSHGTDPRACVSDGKSAMRYVRAHAAELGIDPERLAAGGGSAGGHIAAATATVTAFDDPADDLTVSPKPNALCLFNPVYDNSAEGYGYDRVADYWQAFSPLHNIAAGMPPAIVFLGTKDRLIPVTTAEAFQARMREVGARSDLHLYDGAGHGFFNYGRDDNRWYPDTIEKMDRFLTSLGWLTGDPTITPPAEE